MAVLLGHWPLAAETGGVTPDSSGNGFSGTLLPTYSSDCPVLRTLRGPYQSAPKGMDFDGSNDYISVGAIHNNIGNTFAIAAWIYPNTLERRTIYSAGGVAGTPTFSVSTNSGPGGLEVIVPGIYVAVCNAYVIAANRWTHVVYSRPSSAVAGVFYVDGTEVPNANINGGITMLANGTAWIGCRTIGAQHWLGGLQDVRLYDAALTAQEVYDIYQVSLKENASLFLGSR